MERLEKESGPSKKLTDEQKKKLADIEKIYEAKLAEVKLDYEPKLNAAEPGDEHQAVLAEMAAKINSLEEKREKEKEAVRNR
jgi:hypothetical protein